MMELGATLKMLGERHNCAVLMTNYYVSSTESGRARPALGRSWLSVPHRRLDLAELFAP